MQEHEITPEQLLQLFRQLTSAEQSDAMVFLSLIRDTKSSRTSPCSRQE